MNFIKSSFRVSLLLLLLYSLNTCHGVPMVESMKLYKDTDPVVQMTVVDFKTTIVETANAWLIEFYSSWCGHCIDFAPTFIELANDVKEWEKVIKIGVVDCALDENIPLCREYEIMGYPTLKFFPSFTNSTYLGTPMKGSKKVPNIRQNMIDFVEKQFEEKKGSPHWPVLGTLQNETLADLWAHYNNDEIILLFESEETKTKNEYWSREAILDASYRIPLYPPIRRVGAAERQDLVEKYNVKSLPAFVFLERSGKSELYDIQPSRLFLAKVMHKFFHPDGQDSAMTTLPTTTKGSAMIAVNNAPVASSDKEDRVYMVDIEGAVLYAFGHEVSMHKSIAGKELAALKELIDVLNQYLPGRPVLMEVLQNIKLSMASFRKQIRGDEFARLWKNAVGARTFSKEWVGCRGSKPHLRGYPCSLWTTFHTLTINYALQPELDSSSDPALILKAMKGYIKYFFGCAHCSNHFVDMAEDEANPIESVRTSQQAVLWLWAAHNKVNRRIAGDASEDPSSPKIQFPSPNKCPNCHESQDNVLEYLTRIYRSESISSAGVINSIQSNNEHDKVVSSGSGSVHGSLQSIGTLSFTRFDVSLLAAIYLLSSVILMVVLFRFLLKKRTFRKYLYGKL